MRYPMLKLIKSPNRHYCYDANENQIVPISEQLFQYIHFCQAGGELEEPAVTDDVYSELHDLNEKGLLTNRSNVETIHHPYTPCVLTGDQPTVPATDAVHPPVPLLPQAYPGIHTNHTPGKTY